MKKAILLLALSLITITSFITCTHDDQEQNQSSISQVTFGILQNSNQSNNSDQILIPAKIILTIQNDTGELIYNKKVLDLFDFNGQYLTQNVTLPTGTYTLTEFFVTDKDNKIIYASPLESSDLAQYVNQPLPISFVIETDLVTQVIPEVLLVNEDNTAQDFGYASFGFEIVEIVNTGTKATEEENKRLKDVLSSEDTTTNLAVFIKNENQSSIPNASITLNDIIYTTDEKGSLFIENIVLNQEYQVIKIKANGYTDGIFTFTPSQNGVTSLTYILLEKPELKTFSAVEGGVLTNQNITLNFPENAIANQNGKTYDGNVNVTITYFNPDSENFEASMPGTLVGLDDENNMLALISRGMVKVDLTDEKGNELEILQDNEVEIKMPAKDSDPETIPLWHLNEDHGIWVQTGIATKIGNEYVAHVTHFSTYNLDYKAPSINFTIEIVDESNNPLAYENAILKTTFDGKIFSKQVRTDNKGQFSIIRAPENGTYSIDFLTKCGITIKKSIGKINHQETKTIQISTSQLGENLRQITFEGTLIQCEDKPWANKAFKIELYNGNLIDSFISYTDENGNYSVSKILCNYDTTTPYENKITIFNNNQLLSKTSDLIFNKDIITQNITLCNNNIDIDISTIDDNTVIQIPDEYFKKSIRTLIKVYGRELTYSDLKKIKSYNSDKISFFYDSDKIKSFEGLQYFKNLKILDLSYLEPNFIPDLNSLKNIETIKINSSYPYENISLKNLPNLKTLDLSSNNLKSFSMENLDKLEILNLTNNKLEGSFKLTNHERISSINISDNYLSEIHLENLKSLKSLRAKQTPANYSDRKTLKKVYLKNLSILDFIDLEYEKHIEDITIVDLPSLIDFSLSYYDFNNLTIKNLASLKSLKIDGSVRNINIFELPNLESINIQGNISNIVQFKNSTNLKIVKLGGNITDIYPLIDMKKITHLTLNENVIDIYPIKNIISLKKLYIEGAKLQENNFQYLSNLTNLEYLDLTDSNITGDDFKYLYNLNNLKTLRLHNHHYTPPIPWTNDQIKVLKERLPNLQIYFY